MRTAHLLLLFFSCPFFTNAIAQNCSLPKEQRDLAPNNVRARITTGGDMWWDGNNGRYIVPKAISGQPEVAALFAGGLCIGGYDVFGDLKLAAQTYGRSSGAADFYTGPLNAAEDPPITSEVCENWDRFFKMEQALIDQHIADFEDNGVIDGPVPDEIREWPARGNAAFDPIAGFSLPDADLAPFIDRQSKSQNMESGHFHKVGIAIHNSCSNTITNP